VNKRPLGQSTAFDRTISAQEQAPAQVSSTPQTARWARPAHAIAAALRTGMAAVVVAALGFLPHEMAAAQSGSASVVSSARAGGDLIVEANDAFRKRDRGRLAALRDATASAQHPLASWVAYWDATARLGELTQTDLDDFYLRWTGTYVEDRLRNDWLLELGRRRDWDNFRNDFARFRMNDDREVTCYALLADHLSGKDVTTAARNAWFAQRDADSGCALMAATLMKARVFKPADAWREARLSMEMNRPRAVTQAAAIANPEAESTVQQLQASAARYLSTKASAAGRDNAELTTLALVKLAASNPESAAQALDTRWERALPADLAAWAWASVAKQSAIRLSSDAPDQYDRADRLLAKAALKPTAEADTVWPDDTLAWKVRAALRANDGAGRWQQVVQAVDAMSPTEQREPAWVYWKARGLEALAKDSQGGDALRAESRALMNGIAGQLHFYGKLASEQLAQPLALPPSPMALTAPERQAAASNAGLSRALMLIDLGLRGEGVREWNFTLRGMGDRELLAAAQRACDREVWDRCINTSDRTRTEIDMQQRFPMPFRQQVLAQTQEVGVDPAYVYGLIRQESRFIIDARSHVGASGLMQVMPATARWTAKKIGLDYQASQITDRDTNLKIGMSYLKLVLDDFAGSQALAAAAYNAGPGRPRKWREGPTLETAAWAENIPLSETRDYVKKVLSNAAYYAALLRGEAVSLAPRLGAGVSRREASAPAANRELP